MLHWEKLENSITYTVMHFNIRFTNIAIIIANTGNNMSHTKSSEYQQHTFRSSGIDNSDPVSVNLLRRPGIDSQPDRLVPWYDKPFWHTGPPDYIGC